MRLFGADSLQPGEEGFHGARCMLDEGLLGGFLEDSMCVRGNVSEVARCVYYPTGVHPTSLQAEDLGRLCKMPPSGFVRRHFEAWLKDAAPLRDSAGKIVGAIETVPTPLTRDTVPELTMWVLARLR